MNKQQEREAQIYLESVAGMAKSLALQLEKGSLWEGEFEEQIGLIQKQLQKAQQNSRGYR